MPRALSSMLYTNMYGNVFNYAMVYYHCKSHSFLNKFYYGNLHTGLSSA